MTKINLLPWREQRKKERQQRLALLLAAAAGAGLGVWAAGHGYYDGRIRHQQYRNQMLAQEIAELDQKIARIRQLEAAEARLKARMDVVQALQQERPLAVRLMHQLAVTLPDGVYLTSVQQTQDTIVLSGVAESNARISSFMGRLDASDWLHDPRLAVIQVKTEQGRRLSEFTLQVSQQAGQQDDVSKRRRFDKAKGA